MPPLLLQLPLGVPSWLQNNIPYLSVSAFFPEAKRRKAFRNAEGANGVGGFGRLVGGGPHLWGPPGGVPGGSALAGRRPARVLLGGLAQWGH